MFPKPILLAEDDRTDALVVERLLRKANVPSPLQVVEDGQAAIAYLSGEGQYADRERFPLPGLILLDLHMPRRSGFDVLEWLRGHTQAWRPPVVVLTGSKNIGDIQRAYDLGANAYLVKPVQSEALLDLVAEFNVAVTPSPRVLLLDDNADDRTVILRELRREFPGLEAVEAETTQGLTETLQSKIFDLVVIDFDLHHGWDGLAAARTVKALWPDCPVIMVTGTGSEEAAVEAMKAGLDDYVLKSPKHIIRLPAAARHALARARRRQILRKAEIDRMRAEAALRQSEARFRGLVEAAPDAILGVDRDGRLALVNAQAERAFGYPREAMLGQPVEMLVPERLRDAHSAHRAGYMAGPRLRPMGNRLVLRGRRQDGSEFPAEISLSPVETEEGPLVMAIIHDITERRRAEAALRESEDRYRDLVENSQDLICTHDLEGNLLSVNEAGCRLSGYSREALLKMSLRDLLAPSARHLFGAYLSEIRDAGCASGLMRFQTASGETRFLEYNNTLRSELSVPVVRGMAHDVTERRRAETALAESERNYRALVENAQAGVYKTTLEGEILYANDALVRLMGFDSFEDLRAAGVVARYANPLDRERLLQALRQSGSVTGFEADVLARSGETRSVLLSAALHDGVLSGMIVDVTERKRAEEALEERLRETLLLNRVIAATTSSLEPAKVLEIVCEELARAFDVPQAAAALLNGQRTHLTVVAEYCAEGRPSALGAVLPVAGYPATEYVLQHRQPLAIADVRTDPRMQAIQHLIGPRGTVSLLIVPLVVRDEIVGTIGLDALERREFGPKVIALVQSVAAAASTAMEQARLFAETERRLQRLDALRTIDMAITGSLDPRVTLGVILDQVTARLGADAADILLYHPQGLTLEHAAGRGFRTDALKHTHLRLGDGHAGRAALERRTIALPHLGESEGSFDRAPLLEAEGFAAYFAVPLIAKGQVKGVLEIFHRAPLAPDQEWLDFLQALAGQAAIALDNAALFDGLQRSHADLMLAYDSTIEGWSRALDLRDRETEGHSQRVSEMTLRLARVAGIGEAALIHVRRGALLHDIGKMAVPDSILHKPGPLSVEEWVVMRRHPQHAFDMLSPIAYLRPALDIPYGHHEKWDGTGYPQGLAGEAIPLAARVFAVADVFDALTSNRPYRPAWPESTAREYIGEQAGKHFDPAVVALFLEMPPD